MTILKNIWKCINSSLVVGILLILCTYLLVDKTAIGIEKHNIIHNVLIKKIEQESLQQDIENKNTSKSLKSLVDKAFSCIPRKHILNFNLFYDDYKSYNICFLNSLEANQINILNNKYNESDVYLYALKYELLYKALGIYKSFKEISLKYRVKTQKIKNMSDNDLIEKYNNLIRHDFFEQLNQIKNTKIKNQVLSFFCIFLREEILYSHIKSLDFNLYSVAMSKYIDDLNK